MDASPDITPNPREEAGDFYIEPDCCMLCGVPEDIAPEIFRTGRNHCAVRRQPRSSEQIDRTIHAMWSSEVDCVRYRGRDPLLLKRLAQAGLSDQADEPVPAERQVVRDRVRFVLAAGSSFPASAEGIANAFRTDGRAKGNWVLPALLSRRTVWLSWSRSRFHRVRFSRTDESRGFAADLKSSATQGLSWSLDAWLRDNRAAEIRWEKAGDTTSERPTPM